VTGKAETTVALRVPTRLACARCGEPLTSRPYMLVVRGDLPGRPAAAVHMDGCQGEHAPRIPRTTRIPALDLLRELLRRDAPEDGPLGPESQAAIAAFRALGELDPARLSVIRTRWETRSGRRRQRNPAPHEERCAGITTSGGQCANSGPFSGRPDLPRHPDAHPDAGFCGHHAGNRGG